MLYRHKEPVWDCAGAGASAHETDVFVYYCGVCVICWCVGRFVSESICLGACMWSNHTVQVDNLHTTGQCTLQTARCLLVLMHELLSESELANNLRTWFTHPKENFNKMPTTMGTAIARHMRTSWRLLSIFPCTLRCVSESQGIATIAGQRTLLPLKIWHHLTCPWCHEHGRY